MILLRIEKGEIIEKSDKKEYAHLFKGWYIERDYSKLYKHIWTKKR